MNWKVVCTSLSISYKYNNEIGHADYPSLRYIYLSQASDGGISLQASDGGIFLQASDGGITLQASDGGIFLQAS
ncbi:MAG TPA: hypothetical protein VNZ86_17060, partial [Bacteroidia bacterium]|nr:hypothetical protein [Bacteroidia bacterium]